jgi:transposase
LLGRTPEDVGWQRPTWTRELLCLQMTLEGFPSVAVCTMGRALSRIGARLGTPKPVVLCPWPRERRLRVLAEIRRLEARASTDEPVLYSDEVDIHLNPKIGRDWMLRGHQRRILTPGKNQKFYLAGALDVRTGRLHTTGAERKNAALFCQLLWLLASRYRRAHCIHVILDNYGIHSARLTRKVLADLQGRIVLHFLPPYCPDANRIERVWQDLHANVTRNHRCKTMTRLLDNARRYLDSYRWRRALERPVVRRAA